MTLYLVRHAHAGQRSAWTGDDRIRPLSDRGSRQARAIAGALAPNAPRRLVASPARRCVQTLQPLADELGVEVVEDDRLFEGATEQAVGEVLDEVGADDVALCTHGDVIPIALDLLVARGMRPEDDLAWQKGSVWVVERSDGAWGTGRYLPPPDSR